MNMQIFQLKRNDVESAMKLRALGFASGDWGEAEEEAIIMLQDDPAELFAAMERDEGFPLKRVVLKALPRMSDEQRDEANKKVGVKPPGATTKQAGATGKTRYTYPNEKGGAKPNGQPQAPGQPQEGAQGGGGGAMQEQQQALPHPDTPPPQPNQAPIAAEHPEKPPKDDPRAPDPQKPQDPKHTVNLGELCAALGMQRSVLDQIVARMQKTFGQEARHKFVSFMQTQLKQFAQEHGLDGDYFGLLYDVLTGKVQEGQPASQSQQPVAKKPGSVQ